MIAGKPISVKSSKIYRSFSVLERHDSPLYSDHAHLSKNLNLAPGSHQNRKNSSKSRASPGGKQRTVFNLFAAVPCRM